METLRWKFTFHPLVSSPSVQNGRCLGRSESKRQELHPCLPVGCQGLKNLHGFSQLPQVHCLGAGTSTGGLICDVSITRGDHDIVLAPMSDFYQFNYNLSHDNLLGIDVAWGVLNFMNLDGIFNQHFFGEIFFLFSFYESVIIHTLFHMMESRREL